ncbi:UNVERIFIED_CONTAM: hypothetical protein Sradi_4466200 [Sesamum radiatum]|uniref:Uncharacterized protein n=1 Tax=Sesamum radiatum TaxID=300843 RepID=A0AAW2N6Y2_SESRA
MANASVRLDSGNSDEQKLASFTSNSTEFPQCHPVNSAKSTPVNHHIDEPAPQSKTYAAAVSSNPNQTHLPTFHKFFLAESNPSPIGSKTTINGRPTLSFSDEETRSFDRKLQICSDREVLPWHSTIP